MFVRRRWFDALALLAFLFGFGMLSYGLWQRGTIAGRLPAANMFESLLFLSWGTGAFAILMMLFVRNRGVPLTASAMGAVSLCLADTLPMDQFIRPIAPVLLDTVWMSIHVPVIMVSYSVLALAVLIAHVQVAVMAFRPRDQRLAESVDGLHAWYMHSGAILLFVGIVTGSMWAAFSWGRYWGWDPKEVWSLIAFLGYMVIMHVRVSNERIPQLAKVLGGVLGVCLVVLVSAKLPLGVAESLLVYLGVLGVMAFFLLGVGRFATAAKSILAFWMVIMTYVGVNYVLGIGLHSYGFGTGAIAGRVFLVGMIDLSFVVLCAAIYLVRRRALTTPRAAAA
jgi:ABC-type transport system involved in cytochrome c biogenesis permease subunit